MEIIKEKTVAVVGCHTAEILSDSNDNNLINVISTETYLAVVSLYSQGFRTFLSGISEGFERIATEAVLKFKDEREDIRLVVVLPHHGKEEHPDTADRNRYNRLIEKADSCVCLPEESNVSMVDYLITNSSRLLCYYDATPHDAIALNRAEKDGMPVINIRSLLSGYFANESPAKQMLQPFNRIDGFSYCKEGIMLYHLYGEEPVIVEFERIERVEENGGKLCVTLTNGLVVDASVLAEDL